MKIVFWNVNKSDLKEHLKFLSKNINPDIIFFAECEMSPSEILISLNDSKTSYFYNLDPVCEKIKMFSKFHDKYVAPVKSGLRYTVRSVKVPAYPEFNIMSLHYQSKVNWDFADQAAHSATLNNVIKDVENKTHLKTTMLIGDFNMNPFDFGMIQTTGLHSVMSKKIALKKQRVVDGEEYPFFYNPMWSFFGDKGKGGTNGTIYNTLSKPINYFWNIFDQVLIRPDLIEFFDEDNLEILTSFGTDVNLLNKFDMINDSISDHLPISVTIKKK